MEVQSFDSMEDMWAEMDRAHDQWTALTTPNQRTYLSGQALWWFRYEPDIGIDIWGERWSLEHYAEYLRGRAAACSDPEDAAEWLETIETDKAQLERGYLFGKAYSVAEDRGELGSTHVSQVVEVPRETFELARANGWNIRSMLDDPETRTAARSVTQDWNDMIVQRLALARTLREGS